MKAHKVKINKVKNTLKFKGSFHLSGGEIYNNLIKENKYQLLGEVISYMSNIGVNKRIYTNKEFGVPFVSNTSLSNMNPMDFCKYVSKKYNFDENKTIEEKMILISGIGSESVGDVFYASNEIVGSMTPIGNIIRIKTKQNYPSGYIYSFLKSKIGNSLFKRLISGSGQAYLDPTTLKSIPVPIFPDEKQKQIHEMIIKASELRVEGNKCLIDSRNIFNKYIKNNKTKMGFQVGKVNSQKLFLFQKRLDAQYQLIKKSLDEDKSLELKYIKLKKLLEKSYVGNRSKRNYVDNGIPFISSSDMMLFNPKKYCKKISKNTLGLKDLIVNKDTILISRSGTVGNVVIISNTLSESAVSEHAIKLIFDKDKISPYYVFCFLITNFGQLHLECSAFGSVIITLNEDLIEDIDMPIIEDENYNNINYLIKEYLEKMDNAVLLENQAIEMVEKEIESWQK